MAEALFALGEGLHWAPSSAPQGEFIAIHDRVEASGAFLVHHFLALFLKAGHRVCLLHFANSKEHYAAVGRKLGVNLTTSVDKQTLRMLDGFSAPTSTASEMLNQIRDEIAAAKTQGAPVSIMIDDISTLKWQWGRQQLVQFLRCCRTLTLESQGRATFVVLSHADVEPSSSSDLSAPIVSINPVVAEIATVLLNVAPLPSGYFKDVHGTISVQRQCQGLDGVFGKSSMSFKVLENTIKCFASGGDALRSL